MNLVNLCFDIHVNWLKILLLVLGLPLVKAFPSWKWVYLLTFDYQTLVLDAFHVHTLFDGVKDRASIVKCWSALE